MAKYFSIRVVDANSQEEAIQKVQDGDFDDNHNLSDSIINGDEVSSLAKFPNGFSNWVETHHTIVRNIEHMLDNQDEDMWGKKLYEAQINGGTGGIWILCETLTDKFEQENIGTEWDGEWFDAIDAFLEKELA